MHTDLAVFDILCNLVICGYMWNDEWNQFAYVYLKSKPFLCHHLLLSAPSPLSSARVGLLQAVYWSWEKSGWFVWCRHLACVHFWACRFWQMALKCKHGFWDSGISKLWKGTCTFKYFSVLPFLSPGPFVLREQILSVPPSGDLLHPLFLWVAFATSHFQSSIFRLWGLIFVFLYL